MWFSHIQLCTKTFSLWCRDDFTPGDPGPCGARGVGTEHWTLDGGVGVWGHHGDTILMITWHWTDHCKYWEDYGCPALPLQHEKYGIRASKIHLRLTKLALGRQKLWFDCWLHLKETELWEVLEVSSFPSCKARLLLKVKARLEETIFACCSTGNSVKLGFSVVCIVIISLTEGCKGPYGAHLALKKTLASRLNSSYLPTHHWHLCVKTLTVTVLTSGFTRFRKKVISQESKGPYGAHLTP